MPKPYVAIGFDLLTALLDAWSMWTKVAGDPALGMRWHAASQELLRGRAYRPYEDIVRAAAVQVGLSGTHADELLGRFGEFEPWPDVPGALARLGGYRRFIVTNCSERLATLAAARAGTFDLVVTAERAGAYKPDPRPYRAALDALRLDPATVLFVAGSAHDVGGASRVGMDAYWANRAKAPLPQDARPLLEAPDLSRIFELLG